ncbi:MAG: hypothetical protein LBL66_00730 [Clostridiales bacterium]|nr:hypothetical protein [Clostridiales bacterium]
MTKAVHSAQSTVAVGDICARGFPLFGRNCRVALRAPRNDKRSVRAPRNDHRPQFPLSAICKL